MNKFPTKWYYWIFFGLMWVVPLAMYTYGGQKEAKAYSSDWEKRHSSTANNIYTIYVTDISRYILDKSRKLCFYETRYAGMGLNVIEISCDKFEDVFGKATNEHQ